MSETKRESVPDEINFGKEPNRKNPNEQTVSEEEILGLYLEKESSKYVDIFKKMLKGETDSLVWDKWIISNINSKTMFEMSYENGSAYFGFEVSTDEHEIHLINYHREAKKGKGSEALKDLEQKISLLGKLLNKSCFLTFRTFDQEDTKKWLEKNGYTLNKNEFDEEEYGKELKI